ncbi:magnesium chelatase, partial [bacterium]|nr:magnesium chelatase [bacterium]
DIHVEVPAVSVQELSGRPAGETSALIRERIRRARAVQNSRFRDEKGIFCNAHMGPKLIRKTCILDERGEVLLRRAISRLGLSARAYDRILKVARTIADLASEQSITAECVAEAIQYRSLDRDLIQRSG